MITRAMLEPVVRRQGDAELRTVPGFDHRCCWPVLWPGVLEELSGTGGE